MLTRSGQPRLLIRAKSQTAGLDCDYFYAECNQTCPDPNQWAGTLVSSSFGTSIFDINDDTSPQRSFALDRQDRPRFIYQDRNYPIEPDHIGAFYMACDANCTDWLNWTETRIGQATDFEYEVFEYPSLAFTAAGQPRVAAMIDPLGGDTAFYYVACDSNCGDVNQWQRVKLFERDSGPYVSWDIEVDKSDRPRIAFYKGATLDSTGDRLYFASCNSNCLNDAAWQKLDLGLNSGVGKHPDLELIFKISRALPTSAVWAMGWATCRAIPAARAGRLTGTTRSLKRAQRWIKNIRWRARRIATWVYGAVLRPCCRSTPAGIHAWPTTPFTTRSAGTTIPMTVCPAYLVWHQLWHSTRA